MKIYIVRHGESQDDVDDCYGGIADFPLTIAGENTARDTAARLAGIGITQIFTSPLKRAKQTAEIIAHHISVPLEVVERLQERNSYGVLSGHNKAKANEIFPRILSGITGKPGDYYKGSRIPGDEPVIDFDARVRAAFDECLRKAAPLHSTIAVVTHGNVTRSIYRNILNVAGKVELDLLALTVVNCSDGECTIESKEGVTIAT